MRHQQGADAARNRQAFMRTLRLPCAVGVRALLAPMHIHRSLRRGGAYLSRSGERELLMKTGRSVRLAPLNREKNHVSATSINRARCSSSSAPSSTISRVIAMPAAPRCVSCRCTCTAVSGHCLRAATSDTVMAVHAPGAHSTGDSGSGPASAPPLAGGVWPLQVCCPSWMLTVYGPCRY